MISTTDLANMAAEKMADAESLCESGRFNGAIYLCGYALEMGLKRRICLTLG